MAKWMTRADTIHRKAVELAHEIGSADFQFNLLDDAIGVQIAASELLDSIKKVRTRT